LRTLMAVLFALLPALPFAAARCADFGPISITVPQGFDGPIGGGKGSAKTAAWIRRHDNAQGGTLLQVTTYDEGPDLRSIGWQARTQSAKKYLLEFAAGVAQQRENFQLGEVESLSLAGEPAVRVKWTGTVGSATAIGVMYCVLLDTAIVSFHTQDTGSEITDAMKSAMAAIESMKVRQQRLLGS
jgi:hypothetical protein